jgi:hypothetical protein
MAYVLVWDIETIPEALALLGDDDAPIFGKLDQRNVLKLIKHHESTDGRPCDVHGLRSLSISRSPRSLSPGLKQHRIERAGQTSPPC